MLVKHLCTGDMCLEKIYQKMTEALTGFNNAKDRLSILQCAHVASTHKVKLAVKSVLNEKVTNLEEADIKEILNSDNDAPVVHPLEW